MEQGLRERRARERALALERVPTWTCRAPSGQTLPNSEVVNAAIARARGRVNGYPDRHAAGIRAQLADRHGVTPEQIVVGNGAAELLQAAAFKLLGPGRGAGHSLALLSALPADGVASGRPTGAGGPERRPRGHRRAARRRGRAHTRRRTLQPERSHRHLPAGRRCGRARPGPARRTCQLLVDEAFVQFQDEEDEDSVLRLVDDHHNVVVFRTFSKIYGLSGLRAGYAVGSASAGAAARLARARRSG